MSLANFLEDALLDHVFGGAAYTQPTSWWVQLHIGDPGEDGTANPASETTRIEVTSWTGTNPKSNGNALDWTNVAATETYSHVSIWDASTAGNPLGSGALASPVGVTAADNFSIPIGDLDVSLD